MYPIVSACKDHPAWQRVILYTAANTTPDEIVFKTYRIKVVPVCYLLSSNSCIWWTVKQSSVTISLMKIIVNMTNIIVNSRRMAFGVSSIRCGHFSNRNFISSLIATFWILETIEVQDSQWQTDEKRMLLIQCVQQSRICRFYDDLASKLYQSCDCSLSFNPLIHFCVLGQVIFWKCRIALCILNLLAE